MRTSKLFKIRQILLRALFCAAALGVLVAFPLRVRAQELFVEKSDFAAREVERVYIKGLRFLSKTQTPEGNWPETPYGAEPAVVGLAVVSMLAHGDDPNFGPFSSNIRRGLDFILKQQNAKTGYIGRSMYNHGFATLALAESYGAVDDQRLGPALQKAVNLILDSQDKNPFKAWRYAPESTDADTTVSGAQMVALFAARNAGVSVPEKAIQDGIKFFITCRTPEGGFGYTSGTGPNAARTAIGCLILSLAKEKNTKDFKTAFDFLQKAPGEQNYHHYFLY